MSRPRDGIAVEKTLHFLRTQGQTLVLRVASAQPDAPAKDVARA
jgi:hypothetical protein